VWVGWVAGVDVSPWVGDFEGPVGEAFGVPVGGVEQVVVPRAQEHEVVEAGWSAVGDPAEVVGFGPVGGPVTAGVAAVAVADDEGVEQGGGDGAGGGAVVQDGGAAVGDDPVDAGVTDQALHGRVIQAGAVDEPTLAPPFQLIEGGDDVEVRAVATPAVGLLMVQESAAHVDEGVGASLGGAPVRLALDVTGGGEAQGGGDDGAALGVEGARQFAAPVEDTGQVQRPFRHDRFGVVAHHGGGPPGPVLHRDRRVCDRQRGELGHEFGLVVGE
jgi:hypothetical protein